MVLGFGRQVHKDARAASSGSHQVRGKKQREMLPPSMRSPALESAERVHGRQQSRRASKRPVAPARKMRYAAEEMLVRPALPRKSLPRRSHRSVPAAKPQHTGITAGWRLQTLWEPREQDAAQVISEEEQKKLAALDLDMRLPRIAGK